MNFATVMRTRNPSLWVAGKLADLASIVVEPQALQGWTLKLAALSIVFIL